MSKQHKNKFLETGIEKCKQGKFEEALKDFDKASVLGLSESLLYNRSKALFKLQRLEEALNDLNTLIELQPSNPVWYGERAVIFHHQKRESEAIEDLDKAVSLDPDNGFRYSSRAFIKDYYGDHQGAILDYEKAVELDPEDAISYNNKGLVEEKLGYKGKAKSSFDKADRLDPARYSDKEKSSSSTESSESTATTLSPTSNTKPSLNVGHYFKTLKEVVGSRKGARSFLNFIFGKKGSH